jgi:hypothetical protein
VEQAAVQEHRRQDRDPGGRLIGRERIGSALDRGAARHGRTLGPGVRDLDRNRAVLDHALVPDLSESPESLLEREVDDHVDRDQGDRHDREVAGGDVVLERDHGESWA